jgi:hypothetical protein
MLSVILLRHKDPAIHPVARLLHINFPFNSLLLGVFNMTIDLIVAGKGFYLTMLNALPHMYLKVKVMVNRMFNSFSHFFLF